jgi:hypothetical protein
MPQALCAVMLLAFVLTPLAHVLAQNSQGQLSPTQAPAGNPGTQTNGSGAPAGNPGPAGGQTLVNPLNGISDLPSLLKVVLSAVVKLGSIFLVVAFIWIGFLFVAAQGNPKKLQAARAALIWTVIGGLILLGAQGISDVIQSTANSLGS